MSLDIDKIIDCLKVIFVEKKDECSQQKTTNAGETSKQ